MAPETDGSNGRQRRQTSDWSQDGSNGAFSDHPMINASALVNWFEPARPLDLPPARPAVPSAVRPLRPPRLPRRQKHMDAMGLYRYVFTITSGVAVMEQWRQEYHTAPEQVSLLTAMSP